MNLVVVKKRVHFVIASEIHDYAVTIKTIEEEKGNQSIQQTNATSK
jgi:hypothetical protein